MSGFEGTFGLGCLPYRSPGDPQLPPEPLEWPLGLGHRRNGGSLPTYPKAIRDEMLRIGRAWEPYTDKDGDRVRALPQFLTVPETKQGVAKEVSVRPQEANSFRTAAVGGKREIDPALAASMPSAGRSHAVRSASA